MVGSNWSRVKHVKSGEGFLFHLHFLCPFGIPLKALNQIGTQFHPVALLETFALEPGEALALVQTGGFCQRKSWRFANENHGFYHHFVMVLPAKAGVFAVSQMNNFPEV